MLHMSRKNKIIISIVGISIISLALIGLTYGYYLTRIQGNTNNKSISISTANLELTYSDNSDVITGTNIVPGTTLGTKTFTVTNSGDNNVDSYSVGLVNVINTFTRLDDIKYTVTCSSSVTGKTCNGVSETTFPNENSYIIENQINKNEVQTYVIEVEYKEMNVDQSVDMGKTLEAKIDIFDTKSLTIKGTVTNSSENDYVVINSKEQTSEIVDGKYKFIGIEPDTHKITIKNRKTTTTKQTTLNVSKGEPAASGSNITYNDEKNIADANITITGSTVTIDVTKISDSKILLKDAIINNAKQEKNGTTFRMIPLTTPAQQTSSKYYTDRVDEATTETSISITTTYQRYYWTYGTGYTIDESTGKFTLTGVATCKYNDGTCNTTLVGKYLVSDYANSNSSSTDTIKTTTNLSNIYKVTTAPASSTSSITMKTKKLSAKSYSAESTLSIAEDDYGTSYYYRGGVKDNYIEFNNMCWRIVRVEGDGSIKIILAKEGLCSTITSSDTKSALINNAATVVYGYKTVNSKKYADYKNYSGGLYSTLKAWYTSSGLENKKSLLKNEKWCLGGKTDYIFDENGKSTGYPDLNQTVYYMAAKRLNGKGEEKKSSYKCSDKEDSVDDYIGTITADEMVYAGGAMDFNNMNYYLYDNAQTKYWSLSRATYSGEFGVDGVYYIFSQGNFNLNIYDSNYNNNNIGIRPMIVLLSNAKLLSGNGTISNPYKILED